MITKRESKRVDHWVKGRFSHETENKEKKQHVKGCPFGGKKKK